MKTTFIAGLVGLLTVASAAPAADHVRRANDIGHNVFARQAFPSGGSWSPSGTVSSIPTPTGGSWPTGTGLPHPIPTGSSPCPVNGALVCNGPLLFGLCNWGHVVWQPVADGTNCVEGKVVGTGIYAPDYAMPTAPARS